MDSSVDDDIARLLITFSDAALEANDKIFKGMVDRRAKIYLSPPMVHPKDISCIAIIASSLDHHPLRHDDGDGTIFILSTTCYNNGGSKYQFPSFYFFNTSVFFAGYHDFLSATLRISEFLASWRPFFRKVSVLQEGGNTSHLLTHHTHQPHQIPPSR
jgi:hypothetical protein